MSYLNRKSWKSHLLGCFTFWIKSLSFHNQRVEKGTLLSCLMSDDLSRTSFLGCVNGTFPSWAHLGWILPPWRAGPAVARLWIPAIAAGRADAACWLTPVPWLLCKCWNYRIRGKENCREAWEITSLLVGLQHPSSLDDGGMCARGEPSQTSTWERERLQCLPCESDSKTRRKRVDIHPPRLV